MISVITYLAEYIMSTSLISTAFIYLQVTLNKQCKDYKDDLPCDTGERTSLDDFELLLVLGKGNFGKARAYGYVSF